MTKYDFINTRPLGTEQNAHILLVSEMRAGLWFLIKHTGLQKTESEGSVDMETM